MSAKMIAKYLKQIDDLEEQIDAFTVLIVHLIEKNEQLEIEVEDLLNERIEDFIGDSDHENESLDVDIDLVSVKSAPN